MLSKDEIIRMAREAGLVFGFQMYIDHYQLERFAALVAAHERETCAKVCEEVEMRFGRDGDHLEQYGANQCAAAIRARGER